MKNSSPDPWASVSETPRVQRDPLLDFLRGILILGVISAHFGGQLTLGGRRPTESVWVGVILNQLSHCAVPGLLLLSGYVQARKYAQYPSVLTFYWRRFRSLILPYTFVSGVYTLWAALSPTHFGPHSLEEVLHQYFIFGMDLPLYFVPLLAQCYLLFPVLAKSCSSDSGSNRNCATLFLVLVALYLLSVFFSYQGRFSYALVRSNFFFWGLYFYAGMMLGFGRVPKGPLHCTKRLGVLLVAVAVVLLYYSITAVFRPYRPDYLALGELGLGYLRPVVMAFNAVSVWIIALVILDNLQVSNRYINWLGRHSLIIFLWHMPLLYFFWNDTPIKRLSLTYVSLVPFVLLGTATITALGSELWERLKARNGTWLKSAARAILLTRSDDGQR